MPCSTIGPHPHAAPCHSACCSYAALPCVGLCCTCCVAELSSVNATAPALCWYPPCRELGADVVEDYHDPSLYQRYGREGRRFDVVLDAIGGEGEGWKEEEEVTSVRGRSKGHGGMGWRRGLHACSSTKLSSTAACPLCCFCCCRQHHSCQHTRAQAPRAPGACMDQRRKVCAAGQGVGQQLKAFQLQCSTLFPLMALVRVHSARGALNMQRSCRSNAVLQHALKVPAWFPTSLAHSPTRHTPAHLQVDEGGWVRGGGQAGLRG